MKTKGVTLDRVKEAMAAIRSLEDHEVLVGVPSDKGDRKEGPINNAALAYIHEKGAPEAHIPARPFLVPAIEENRDKFAERFKRLATQVADTMKASPAKVMAELNRIGLMAQAAARRKITEGPFEPLKQSTINARRRRSKGSKYRRKAVSGASVKPLIDTAQMRDAINFVVREHKHG